MIRVVRQWLILGWLTASMTLPVAPAHAADYAASFKNTDITEFIQVVGRNLGKTIIIDPDVRGKIDVRSYDVMNEQQYWQFFLNVLEVYGYAAVTMDSGVIKVIRDKDASKGPIPVVDGDGAVGDTMVTRVVPVKNVSVRELAPLLRQLNDQTGGGMVTSYDPSNVIMMTGRAETVQRLVEIIERVDRAGDQSVEVIKLDYASASEVVNIAKSLYERGQDNSTPELLMPKVVADERTNSVIVSGEPKARTRVVNLIKKLDQDLKTRGNTRVFYLKYAKAADMVEVLQGVSQSIQAEDEQGQANTNMRRTRSGGQQPVSINAHEDTNAIVITAQPDILASLEGVIRRLDIRRAQVLVEAIIVEILEGDGINFGVQWISKDGGLVQYNDGSQVPIGSLAAAAYQARPKEGSSITRVDNAGNQYTETEPDEPGDVTLLAQLLGSVNGMMFGTINDDWAAVVQAVKNNTNSNILATPSIVTVDNETASFLVGQEVPVITGSTAGANNENPFQTVERKEIGIKLEVTPQINEGDAVQLLINQEVSSLSGATAVDITTNKRELKTTVMAQDGQTIVLGGLIDDNVQESVSKIPLLGDIPIIGNLFKSTSTTTQKRNLMIFIRPTIIRDGDRLGEISNDKYNYMRALQLDRRARGVSLMPNTDTPVMPEWNEKLALPPSFREYMDKQQEKQQPKAEAEGGSQ